MRASKDGQGESFQGCEGRECESKTMFQMLSESRHVTIGTCQCLIRSVVNRCLNLIDWITLLTVYSIGRLGG
jgi:hypothetical protein